MLACFNICLNLLDDEKPAASTQEKKGSTKLPFLLLLEKPVHLTTINLSKITTKVRR